MKECDTLDIYKFINSRDIREYLKNINYNFSTLEVAWIVWKSKYTTLKEKHDAWNEIIATMPDCTIEKRSNTLPQPSLHRYLEKIMEIENKYIEAVQVDEPECFYFYTYTPDEEWYQGQPTPNYSECFKAAVASCYYESETKDISNYRIRIRKVWFNGEDEKLGLEVTTTGEVLKVLYDDFKSVEELEILDQGFDGMWFDFPNPFKRGDIIYNPARFSRADFECDYGPCVLEEEIPLRRCVEHLKKSGGADCSDMTVDGLFQHEDGTIFAECTANYMNFEYYRGELDGKKRILKAISNYLKGEISLELLLASYHTILAEEWAKDTRPCNITEKGLELAGIPKGKGVVTNE